MICISPNYIWTGFSTGKIFIFDVSSENGILLNEFQAHPNSSVSEMMLDQKSLLKTGKMNLISV
jgi:hypothetical protein